MEWRGSDADGDELTYMVLYSPDNGDNWRMVGYEVEGTVLDLPIRGMPTGPRVRVLASDGVLSAADEVSVSVDRTR